MYLTQFLAASLAGAIAISGALGASASVPQDDRTGAQYSVKKSWWEDRPSYQGLDSFWVTFQVHPKTDRCGNQGRIVYTLFLKNKKNGRITREERQHRWIDNGRHEGDWFIDAENKLDHDEVEIDEVNVITGGECWR
jgi:hypothetical protein